MEREKVRVNKTIEILKHFRTKEIRSERTVGWLETLFTLILFYYA